MSWRNNAQRTGENAAPLGAVRRWGGGAGGASSPAQSDNQSSPYGAPQNGGYGGSSQGYGGPPSAASPPRGIPQAAMAAVAAINAAHGYGGGAAKREREEPAAPADPNAPRKRRSRWGDATEKVNLGVATAIGANVSAAELDRYAVNVRLEEINRKLASGDFVPPERERSPSPPPIYDGQGRRTNTREVRYRKKLEEEKVQLIERQMKLDPNYRPPAEYQAARRNMRPTEKVYLPIKEFPDINFFGLLVGPRGNTLKGMERDSGAKIAIRGRGSVKDGKGRPGGEDEEEEMHCVVTADDEAKVKKCVRLINGVIETAASTPEAQNDHKRNQLRELAALNGTLRDDENQICQNCGQKGHRKFECPEERNWTAHITCHRCGGQGHLARDCTAMRQPGAFGGPPMGGFGGPGAAPGGHAGPNGQFDAEYASLMAELGEGGAAGGAPGGPGGAAGPDGGAPGATGPRAQAMSVPLGPDGKKIPPWRDPSVWNPPVPAAPRGPRFGMGFGGAPQGGFGGGQGYGQQQQGLLTGHGPQPGWPNPQPGALQGAAQGAGAEGQKDYTKEWEEYYRQQALLAQQQQQGGAAAPGASASPGGAAGAGTAAAAGAQGGEQRDYTKEWEEYYRQQALAAQQQQQQ